MAILVLVVGPWGKELLGRLLAPWSPSGVNGGDPALLGCTEKLTIPETRLAEKREACCPRAPWVTISSFMGGLQSLALSSCCHCCLGDDFVFYERPFYERSVVLGLELLLPLLPWLSMQPLVVLVVSAMPWAQLVVPVQMTLPGAEQLVVSLESIVWPPQLALMPSWHNSAYSWEDLSWGPL